MSTMYYLVEGTVYNKVEDSRSVDNLLFNNVILMSKLHV